MDFEAEVKNRYPHLRTGDVTSIVAKAKMFYYGLKYPCEPYASEETHPIIGYVNEKWVLSACEELIDRLGFNSAVSYKENGVTWNFDGAQLSDRLVNLIKPTIGVII